ncbi:type II secretion system protein GspN [Myxococcota bacterium]|nr:type II secretion system protein GspN [Myxococcota bacterium]
MDRLIAFLSAPIPRPLLWVFVPVAALVLVTIFVFLRFPFGEFAPTLARQLSQTTGGEVLIGDIEPRWTIGGPGMAARDVRVIMPARTRIDIDPLTIRPAWSTSWLGGDPAFQLVAVSPLGALEGTLELGDVPSWSGDFIEIDLGRLPLPPTEGFAIEGLLTGEADLSLGADGARGPLRFEAIAGRLDHSALPVGLEFDVIRGDVILGGLQNVEIQNLQFTGPIIEASGAGTILSASPQQEPNLDLDVEIEIKNPPLRAMLEGMGLPLGNQGRSRFSVQGTPSQPRIE